MPAAVSCFSMFKFPTTDELADQRVARNNVGVDLVDMLQYRQQIIDLRLVVNVPKLLVKHLLVDTQLVRNEGIDFKISQMLIGHDKSTLSPLNRGKQRDRFQGYL